MYISPLASWFSQGNGKTYVGVNDPLYLVIDIKTPAHASLDSVENILARSPGIFRQLVNGPDSLVQPVQVIISGHAGRPFERIIQGESRLSAIDGRVTELGREIPVHLMPLVSEPYKMFCSWDGNVGKPKRNDRRRLKAFIRKAHGEGRKVRLWAAPDNPATWDFLLSQGVDLINTDRIEELSEFLKHRKAKAKK